MGPWFDIICPGCKSNNWFTPSSQEAVEYDACECWQCHGKFWIEEDESIRAYFLGEDDTLDTVQCVDGLKQPR